MMMSKLPRASTRAFELLRQQHEGPRSEPAECPEPSADASKLVQLIDKLKRKDTRGLLSPPPQGSNVPGEAVSSLSMLEASVLCGQCSLEGLAEQFRTLCDLAISSHFYSDRKLAQEANDLLDYGNVLLQELEPESRNERQQAPAQQQLPSESFFLPLSQAKQCLAISIDEGLLARSGRARKQAQPKEIYSVVEGDCKPSRSVPAAKRKKVESIGKKKGRRSPLDPWTPELQFQVALVLDAAMHPNEGMDTISSLPQELQEFADSLITAGAKEQVRGMGATLARPSATLRVGGYVEPEELVADVGEECHEAAEAFATLQNPGVRRGKITGAAEAFISLLAASLEVLLSSVRAALVASGAGKEEEEVEDLQPVGELPPAILANREPYRQGDWRKKPFAPRPYVRLTEYDIVEPAMRSVIRRKLSTRKHGDCDGRHCKKREDLGCYSIEQESFVTKCPCLKRNTECDAGCACHATGGCLNRAVGERRTLQLGVDVREIDSWGLDCYTRRNIHDAVLESQAFGRYNSPLKAPQTSSPTQASLTAAAGPSTAGSAPDSDSRPSESDAAEARNLDELSLGFSLQQQQQQAEQKRQLQHAQQMQQLHELQRQQQVQQALQVQQLQELQEQHQFYQLQQLQHSHQVQQVQQVQQMQMQGLPINMQLLLQQRLLFQQQQQQQQLLSKLQEVQQVKQRQLQLQLRQQHQLQLQQLQVRQQQQAQQQMQQLQAQQQQQQQQQRRRQQGLQPLPVASVSEAAPEHVQQAQQADGHGESKQQEQRQDGEQQSGALEQQVVDWIERTLLPAINRQGDAGWDILQALAVVKREAKASSDQASFRAASAVEARVKQVGYNYFRVHPKGTGLMCVRQSGLPPLTFVEEYLGEIHTPWRWFEIQDAVKKITGDELPDFYNIILERPKDDPSGYDVLYIDAAAKGACASRMSHSCTPNCQAVVMACNGRLTIALYTLRHVHPGEELTFDYASVTESEKEFKEAICLCSTHLCRGSYLMFTGSRAFMQVMGSRHNFLHRQALIARASCEPLTEEDLKRLDAHGLRASCLGGGDQGPKLPGWLHKWAALVCEFLELEEACLQKELLAHPLGLYNETLAAIEARGVVSNRLQNVVVTLDKVKMVLSKDGQPQSPCLRLLSEEEALAHLWTGSKSIARRVLKGLCQVVLVAALSRDLLAASTSAEWEAAVGGVATDMPAELLELCQLMLRPVSTAEEARRGLQQLITGIRQLDKLRGGGLTACADILQLYASTRRWLAAERGYKAVLSPPVPLNLADLNLDRTKGAARSGAGASSGNSIPSGGASEGGTAAAACAAEEKARLQKKGRVPSRASVASLAESGGGEEEEGGGSGNGDEGGPSSLRKIYRPLYVWGQLSGWFKQTVNDPTASLSAERRGTLSLPDIESCFGGKGKYGAKERGDLLEQLERRPDSMWRIGTQWSFRNDTKVYGSPMLDAVWDEMEEKQPSGMETLLQQLKTAEVPFKQTLSEGGGSRGIKKRGKGQQ